MVRILFAIWLLCSSVSASSWQDIGFRFAGLSTLSMFLTIPLWVGTRTETPDRSNKTSGISEIVIASIGVQLGGWFLLGFFRKEQDGAVGPAILGVTGLVSQILALCANAILWHDLDEGYQQLGVKDKQFQKALLGCGIVQGVTSIFSWCYLIKALNDHRLNNNRIAATIDSV